MFPKSKLGLILAFIYSIITIIIVIYSFTCSGMFCGLWLILPVMPWNFILEGVIRDSLTAFVFLAVLNAIIFYFIGYFIDRLRKNHNGPREN